MLVKFETINQINTQLTQMLINEDMYKQVGQAIFSTLEAYNPKQPKILPGIDISVEIVTEPMSIWDAVAKLSKTSKKTIHTVNLWSPDVAVIVRSSIANPFVLTIDVYVIG